MIAAGGSSMKRYLMLMITLILMVLHHMPVTI
jgi:hypothetical protein